MPSSELNNVSDQASLINDGISTHRFNHWHSNIDNILQLQHQPHSFKV